MEPSPEAVAWGKRQASKSPRWTDDKWSKIEVIFGVELVADEVDEQAASLRDVA